MPDRDSLGKAAAVGVVVGGVLGGVLGVIAGIGGTVYLANRNVKVCHGCKGSAVRVGEQRKCPRCDAKGSCLAADGIRGCLLCCGQGVLEFATAPCLKCKGQGVTRALFSRSDCKTCAGKTVPSPPLPLLLELLSAETT